MSIDIDWSSETSGNALDFTMVPVDAKPPRLSKKGRARANNKWNRVSRGFKSMAEGLNYEIKETLDLKGLEIVDWLEEDHPEFKGGYDIRSGKYPKGYTLEIRAKDKFKIPIGNTQFGFPDRPGNSHKPITFMPEQMADILGEMYAERAIWEAQGGYAGTGLSNPFGEAAEDKLINEGVIIRWGPIGGKPGSYFINEVIRRKTPEIRKNFARAIRKTFRRSFRGTYK